MAIGALNNGDSSASARSKINSLVNHADKGAAWNMHIPQGADAAAVVAAVALAAGGGIVRLLPGVTYTLRNVELKAGVVVMAHGAIVQYGGSYGTSAPLESVPVLMYGQGSAETPLQGIAIYGGTWIGGRTGTDYNNTGGAGEDAIEFDYCPGVIVEGARFLNVQQDAVTLSHSPGARVTNNSFEHIGDAAVELRTGSDYTVSHNRMDTVRNMVACKPNIDRVVIVGNIASTFSKGLFGHGNNWTIADNIITATTTPDGQDGADDFGISLDASGGLYTPNNVVGFTVRGNQVTGRTSATAISIGVGAAFDISGVLVEGNVVSGYSGINAENADDLTIADNVLLCTNVPIYVNATCTKAVVSNNRAKAGNGAQGIYTGSASTVVGGNNVEATSAAGIYVAAGATNSVVLGNVVDGDTAEAIHVLGNGSVVSGNVGIDGTQGVRVAADDCAVSGNRFTGMTFYGVNVSSGKTGNIVVGNQLKGNGSGGISDSGTGTMIDNNVVS